MSLLTKRPSQELANFVYRYTSMSLSRESTAKLVPHGSFRLPNSLIRLAFHFTEIIPWIEIRGKVESQAKHHVRGYQTSPVIFNTTNRLDVFSIELTPFGFRNLFGIPCSELDIAPISMEAIIGKDYEMLIEELTKRNAFNDRVVFLNAYFSSKLTFGQAINKANSIQNYILKYDATPSVSKLANEIFTTERTMRRFFNEHFGISPKQYLKLVRFEKAIKSLSLGKTNLFRTAFDFGYYDQAHFTNDFKYFMDMTPRDYQNNILNNGVKIN